MDALFFFLPCCLLTVVPLPFLVLFAVLLMRFTAKQKQRVEDWRQAAEAIGLSYHGQNNEPLTKHGHLKLLNRGRDRQMTNVTMGDAGDMAITLADFRYTTGSGKERRTHYQTICILREQSLQLTHCFLRPQVAVFDFLGRMLGGQDINFLEDPAFSDSYVLQGEDEAAVGKLFDNSIRAWFTQRKGRNFHFEAAGDTLMFHTGSLIEVDQLRPLMEQAVEIKNLLAAASNS